MISFIIPTLNEINNVDVTVNKIKCLFSINEEYEIIFVDDNSEDGTLQKIQLLSQENNNIKCYIPEKRLGLGNALSIGQKKAKGNFIFFLDCDNSINSDNLISLINAKDSKTLVIGSRYIKNSKINGVSIIKIFLSRMLNFLVSIYLRIPAKDISHSCRIFPNIETFITKNYKHPIFFWEHSLFFTKRKFKIVEIPINFDERTSGKTKNSFFSLFKNIFFSIRSIIKLKFKYK